MMRIRRMLGRLGMLGAAALLVAACGGGGGGGGGGTPSLDLLSGAYGYVLLTRDTQGGAVRTETGLLDSDGQGTLTPTSMYAVVAGATFGPYVPQAFAYTEAADRRLVVTGLGAFPLEGRIASDGSLALVSSRAPGDPSVAILVRRDTSPGFADLAGYWTQLSWRRITAPSAALSSANDATISAAGVLIVDPATFTYNLDGAIDPMPYGFLPEQLSVQPDGWLVDTIPPSGDVVRRGAISADHDVILLGGDSLGGDLAAVTVLVRRNQVATDAALTGSYYECNFESSFLGYLSGWGPVGLDGAGGGTWSYAFNLEGASFGPGPITLGYAVDPAGRVLLTDTGSNVSWLGAVGGGGRYVFLSGGYLPGSNPLLMVLLR